MELKYHMFKKRQSPTKNVSIVAAKLTKYRCCRNCGGKLSRISVENMLQSDIINLNPYDSLYTAKSNPPINYTVGEPDFVNPSSFENTVLVLQSIGRRAVIKNYGGTDREWPFVECDGLPYNAIRTLIHVWHCTLCQDCFYKLSSFHDHKCYVLHKVVPIREFGWVILMFGLLHLEMNTARSFIKQNWNVFTSTLGHELGFKSMKAQKYLFKGSEHHKTSHFWKCFILV